MSVPSKDPILIVTTDIQVNLLLERVLKSAGHTVQTSTDLAAAEAVFESASPLLVILGEKFPDGTGLEFAAKMVDRFPSLPILLFVYQETIQTLRKALSIGISDVLCLPLKPEELLNAVDSSLEQSRQRKGWLANETKRVTDGLRNQVDELETLSRLGRTITGSLDLDSVLSSVVDAAVELTGTEEGSLLLIDETSGELYMRASRNFQEEFVHTFRLPITDSMAGQVITTGQPLLYDQSTAQKIKTSYLVHSLVYVPLQIRGKIIGVLGVDNRIKRIELTEHHVRLLSFVADYAVIAIENAHLFANTNQERTKLETVLTKTQDGVILLDLDDRLMLVNQAALKAYKLGKTDIIGQKFEDVFTQCELLELVKTSETDGVNRIEINLDDGRVLNAQITPIADVGKAITMHDISYLKEMDRIKSDFVNTVSHDLRSPLTAILGYVELIERVGPVSDVQRDFIRHVQVSVHNITNLVDDLLNLGRIEGGFDTRLDNLNLEQMVRQSIEGFRQQLANKGLRLAVEFPQDYPSLTGNPVQMRQVVDNLLENAIKYTSPGGLIKVHGEVEDSQLFLQFQDTGVGIPPLDLPYIFDKFYRASNIIDEASGTGLGLAIVKSIIENHQGRIWVESILGEGSTFTVVLPKSRELKTRSN
jgi:signal transduction histidine kinase/DNA-binding response OmpR family regulator